MSVDSGEAEAGGEEGRYGSVMCLLEYAVGRRMGAGRSFGTAVVVVVGAVRVAAGEVEEIVMLGTGGRDVEAKVGSSGSGLSAGRASSDSGMLVWFVRTLYSATRRRRRSVSACDLIEGSEKDSSSPGGDDDARCEACDDP